MNGVSVRRQWLRSTLVASSNYLDGKSEGKRLMDSQEQSELLIEQIEIGPMQNFVYVVGSRSTREVVVVDPAWEIDQLLEHLASKDYALKGALVTHYHPDHI